MTVGSCCYQSRVCPRSRFVPFSMSWQRALWTPSWRGSDAMRKYGSASEFLNTLVNRLCEFVLQHIQYYSFRLVQPTSQFQQMFCLTNINKMKVLVLDNNSLETACESYTQLPFLFMQTHIKIRQNFNIYFVQ